MQDWWRPADDLANCREQTGVDQVLAHESVSATHGGDVLLRILGVSAHQEDLPLRSFLLDASRQLQPVEARHHQVRDYDVGAFV